MVLIHQIPQQYNVLALLQSFEAVDTFHLQCFVHNLALITEKKKSLCFLCN
uniref:Uncharacterized protein n=1 Tax=Octopus bimaculoides TaxID=37653 RepID=A0A0L8G6S1_OCTBM